LVAVGYKWLLGPFALSYLYVAPEHREGRPLEQNWILRAGSEDFARLVDYRDDYQPGARRFDMGQRTSFQLVPMAIAALEQLLEWKPPRIAATLADLNAALAERLGAMGLESLPAEQRGPHMLGVALPAAAMAAAPAALAAADCFAAVRGHSLRISPHLHNTPEEADRLADALAATIAG
jgi:selenocysteine lyase/cysteine desulfurase